MVREIALFPLNLVVFPKESLNLHIFEPRYKQLINDCLKNHTTFGIPSHVVNKLEYGTEVKIVELTKKYDDGRMDIKTEGVREFKIIDFHNPWTDKLYAGGKVEFLHISDDQDSAMTVEIMDKVRELFTWLQLDKDFDLIDKNLYAFIHKIGLKPEEEYQLLQLTSQKKRQEYILEHLNKIIPMLERAEKAREIIKMNGHFKHLDPLKF
ncbi:MAG: LON peptidase substrate-binding domain-containing protein [Cyclobacteriaceae bacterium]|nr:LON peptidase substrate-binding domain-containing protein [Cyclobacteriaceae bacterium SS2]